MSARRPGDGGRVWREGPEEGEVIADLCILLAGYDYEQRSAHSVILNTWTANPESLGPSAEQRAAAAALLERLGITNPPEAFHLRPHGDVIALGRLSSREAQNAESVFQQIVAVLRMCHEEAVLPYKVIASTNNSGRRRFEERPDFAELRDVDIAGGRCRKVAALSIDRLVRKASPGSRLIDLLQDTDTELYLNEFRGLVDFDDDEFEINTRTLFAAEHAKRVYNDTHRALQNIYPSRGLGWPGCRPFGFRRNKKTRELEVDPEQWPFVKIIHYQYGQKIDGVRLGLRPLQKKLKELGCELSFSQIRNIIRNRIYVDGHYTVKVAGKPIAQKPIEITDPIPAEIFDRNQRVIPVHRGRNSLTPLAYYALNHVDVWHAKCMANIYGEGRRPSIKGAFEHGRPGPYRHLGGARGDCPGWKIAREDLDRTVMRALRELATSPEIQEAWGTRQQEESAPRNPEILGRREIRELEVKLAQLEDLVERESAPYVDALLAEQEPDREEHARRVDPLLKRKALYERQLEVAKAMAAGHERNAEPELGPIDEATALQALQEILTDDPPDEEEARIRRAAAARSMISVIILHDTPRGTEVELIGPLVPDGYPKLGMPLSTAAKQVQEHLHAKRRAA